MYCFAPVDWVGKWIANNINLCGVIDLGGNNAISVGKVAQEINSKSKFKGPIDHQVLSQEIKSAPEAKYAQVDAAKSFCLQIYFH